MTKLLSTKETVRFSPSGEERGPSEDRITYSLRVPTVYDRARLRRACLARGARHWSDVEMMAVLENGVRELLSGEVDGELRDQFLADIETYTAHLAAGDLPSPERSSGFANAGDPPPELKDRIAEIEAAVARGYGPYAERVADRTYWADILPIEAVRLFVVGWEGLDSTCALGPEGLTEVALGHIPRSHLTPLGFKALSLFGPTEGQAKN